MRQLFKNVGLLLLSMALVFTALGILLQNYMQSPGFIEKISQSFSEFLDGELEVESAEINLLRGVALNEVSVSPSESSSEPFLQVDGAYLNYNLLGLFTRKLQLDMIRLRKPVLTFAQTREGTWWFPKTKATERAEFDTGLLTFEIILDDFALNNGQILIVQKAGTVLLESNGIGVEGTLLANERGISAEGNLTLNQLLFGSYFEITGIRGNLIYKNEVLTIPNLTGKTYEGTASGTIKIDLRIGDPEFSLAFNLADLNLAKLISAVYEGSSPLQGRLSTVCQLEGTFEQPEKIHGTGTLKVENGRLADLDFFKDLNELFREKELPEARFTDISGSYKIANKILTVYNLEAVGEEIQLTASGTVTAKGEINFDMRLTLTPKMANLLPTEIAERWNLRDDGTRTITFNLFGSLSKPRSNFREKLDMEPATPPPSP